jgi:hypothetical protein
MTATLSYRSIGCQFLLHNAQRHEHVPHSNLPPPSDSKSFTHLPYIRTRVHGGWSTPHTVVALDRVLSTEPPANESRAGGDRSTRSVRVPTEGRDRAGRPALNGGETREGKEKGKEKGDQRIEQQ